MREHGVRAAREHRRHPSPASRKAPVTDREHTPVQAMEATTLNPPLDSTRRQPEVDELRERHHPVLARCQLCEAQLGLHGEFSTVCVRNSPLIVHPPSLFLAGAHMARTMWRERYESEAWMARAASCPEPTAPSM
jgi:hypothetical protein